MLLTLKVIRCGGQQPPEPTSVSFDQKSGTIGRSADNDLVLPDAENYISRHHAEVSFEAGRYILSDTSLMGTVIDDGEPLKKGSVELRDGMKIYIGEYELAVQLQESPNGGDFTDEFSESDLMTDIIHPDGGLDLDNAPEPASFPDFDEQPSFDFPEDERDPFSGFESEPVPSPDPLADLEKKSPTFDSFEPPSVHAEPPAADFPEDFDIEDLLGTPSPPSEPPVSPEPLAEPLGGDEFPIAEDFDFGQSEPPAKEKLPSASRATESTPETASKAEGPVVPPEMPRVEVPPAEMKPPEQPDVKPARRPVKAASGPEDEKLFDVLLAAAGIDEPDFLHGISKEDTVRLIGLMFRDLLDGIMTLLRSRAELKNQFRVSRTTIRPVENNPLKFEVTVPNALETLLKPGQRGYLKPLDAIQNGFNDVSNHQLAMTAGIQASLTDLLKRFDPERFEKQIEGGIFTNKDAKCWEAYTKAYERLVAEAIDDFFGNAFVNAYEKQIQVLESIGGKK